MGNQDREMHVDLTNPDVFCGTCSNKITPRNLFVNCALCKSKIHIKCNHIEYHTYHKMNKKKEISMCTKCNENMPFHNTKDFEHRNFNNEFFASEDMKIFFKGLNDHNTQHHDQTDYTDDSDITQLLDCKYFDIESFKVQKFGNKNFSVLHLNIGSLGAHKDELESILSALKFKFDVIGISETKIKKDVVPNYDINIKGYIPYSTPSLASKGGVMLYISDKHDSKPRKDLERIVSKDHVLESAFAEIVVPTKKNIILGCIYRHPSMEVNDFNEGYLSPLMEKLPSAKHTFLLGDFNIDLMKSDEDENTSNYFDTLTSLSFIPHIIHPTRITPHSKTLIDNIFSNVPNFSQGKSGNLTISLSDHLAQFLVIPLDTCFVPPKVSKFKRDTRNFDRENFFLDLLSIDWNAVIEIDKRDPNYSFMQYYSTINKLIDKYMPLIEMTQKEIQLQSKPWITKEILKMINEREKLYKMYIKSKNSIIKEEFHNKYKELRNKIRDLTRKSQKEYLQEYFAKNIKNIKNTWKGIKSIIKINTSNRNQPNSLLVNNKLVSEPKEVAETFNEYFSSIAEKLQKKIKHAPKHFSSFLKNPNPYNFFIMPANITQVINTINELNSSKSLGPYSTPTDIFHLIKLNVAEPLTEIINLSFQEGIYIDQLKIAKVVAIFKEKGCHMDCTNYRPISLLSNINKIIEKLMHERLYSFLEKHRSIYELQFGFRSKHSTGHALTDLTEAIRKAMDESSYAVGVFIDLQKAFDTVDHNILLSKLDHYGIRGVSNNWFRSYLTNRQQYVTVNGKDSDLRIMKFGVPQGSVLGPLLFLIYINDLYLSIKHSTARHFADDTCLLIKSKSLKRMKKLLNQDLKSLNAWLKANKISLNASKTEILIFKHHNKPLNYDLKIKLDGKRLYPSKYVKYLGILIDSQMNWSYHIKSLVPKLARANGMLAKIRHYVSKESLRSIYFAIFSSLMNYGAHVWGQVSNGHVKRIMKLQDKSIRIINFAKYHEPTSKLYQTSNILKFEDQIKLSNYFHVHDSINRKLPPSLQDKFQYLHEIHTHKTKSSDQFCVKLPKTNTVNYGINSITGQAARSWNDLHLSMNKNLHILSRAVCKHEITKFMFETY